MRVNTPDPDPVVDAAAWGERTTVAEADTGTRMPARRESRMWGFRIAIAITALAVALSLASRLATPLDEVGARGAPSTVEVTSTTRSPVTALLWGEGVGFHIVRVPGSDAGPNDARRLPAPMLKGDVHLLSLGVGSLSARAFGDPTRGGGMYTARSRSITIFSRPGMSGIRAW